MRKIVAFNFVSLNGYFKGSDNDINWYVHGVEERKYSEEAMQEDGILLFGRVTYEMMASYWPGPMAAENDPIVASGMNNAEKIVFSDSLKNADWNNSTIMNGDVIEKMRTLKRTPGKDMAILGSGTIVNQFTEAGLIDEYQIMVDPVILTGGTPIFNGVKDELRLELVSTRSFKSGVVLLVYKPQKQ